MKDVSAKDEMSAGAVRVNEAAAQCYDPRYLKTSPLTPPGADMRGGAAGNLADGAMSAGCGASASREMTGSELLDGRAFDLMRQAQALRTQADRLETEANEMSALASALPTGQGSCVGRAIRRLLNTRYGL